MCKNLKTGVRSGSKFGTGRTRELLARLGNPDKKLKIIHVAGSNGKGSLCAFITSVLVVAGKRVGTFTSPQVFCYEEQFCLSGIPTDSQLISQYMLRAKELARGMADEPSPFEYEVCAALGMFAGEGCEYCVLECGLGGLYDATNAIARKEVAVITSISLEHTDVLGDTIMDICRHKGGIIDNCPAIVPANLPAEAAAYFSGLGATVAGRGIKILSRSPQGMAFCCGGEQYSIPFFGEEQVYNAALAIECARMLGIEEGAVKRGLASAKLPGRVQTISKGGHTYILDGAHNPAAFAPLIQRLELEKGKKSLIYACLSDKDVNGCAAILSPHFDEIILIPAPCARAMDLNKIEGAFARCGKNARSLSDIPAAMARASYRTVAICGSFTLLKEALNWIEKRQ